MDCRKKIFIMVLPSFGHINPITGLARELVLKQKYDVFFYGNSEQQNLIEKTGSTFRQYSNMPMKDLKSKPLNEDKNGDIESFFFKMINCSYLEVPFLIKEIERDRPDLVVYDHMSLPARFALKIMEARFNKGLIETSPPMAINFYTCFVNKKGIYPNDELIKKFQSSSLRYITNLARIIFKQTLFSWKFGIDIYNTVEFTNTHSDKLNIVSVFPELHPFSEGYDKTFKFVGPCISEMVRKSDYFDPKLAEILDLFEPINPNFSRKTSSLKLVYASLGTVFNENIFIYDLIIESIRLFNERNNEKSYDLKVVLSVGKNNKKIYHDKILNGKLNLPPNILLMESVPQVDVLERTSVFITHCGMNSASESIQYGVPMVCLPIKADQPFVAHRLCDDLNLGIRFDPLKTTPSDLTIALETILKDSSYFDTMLNFTKICRQYNGSKISADLVEEFLEN